MPINGHITDTEDNRFSQDEAKRQAVKAVKDKAELMTKITVVIAGLAKIATRIALEGIRNFFSFSRSQNKSNSLTDNLFDNISDRVNRRKVNKSKNLFQRLGNKSRGINRGLSNKLRSARKVRKLGKVAKVVSKGRKLARFARTAKTAKSAVSAVKTAKTAHTAYKAYKVAKLANLGRIAVTGGAALAGGPVGIGLLVGSVVAPIAIEQIWKNRESIYEGGKNLVAKSKVSVTEVKGLTAGKNAQIGEIVSDAAGLKVQGSDKSILLEADATGKIITNSFQPEQKLAFYQGNDQNRTMLIDEEDVWPSQEVISSTSIDLSKSEAETKTIKQNVSGTSVIMNSLDELSDNNPENIQIQNQVALFKEGLSDAQETKTPGIRASVKLNEAGTSIIELFNSAKESGQRNQPLETEGYQISRRGNTYFLKDKQGEELLKVKNTVFGSRVLQSNLNSSQMEDLTYLKEDLRLAQGITGDFIPKQAQDSQSQDVVVNSASVSQDSAKQDINSVFSQYLEERDQNSRVDQGNTMDESLDPENDYER